MNCVPLSSMFPCLYVQNTVLTLKLLRAGCQPKVFSMGIRGMAGEVGDKSIFFGVMF